MNLGDLKTRVAKTLDNLPTSDPWYTEITSYLNRAANVFIRMKVNAGAWSLFPELYNSWTVGPTYPIDGTIIIDASTIARPSDCLVVQEIARAESATLPDWTATKELPVRYVNAVTFGQLSKESGVANYIRIFSRKGKTVKVWPSITSSYPDYLRFYGPKTEVALVADADTWYMDEHWHDDVALLASHRLAVVMGLRERAADLSAEIKDELGITTDVTAEQDDTFCASVLDAPSAFSVYGNSWRG